MTKISFLLAMSLGCGGSDDKSDSGTAVAMDADADADADADVDLPSGLNGTVVDPRRPVPEFSATNRDGSARGPADLTDGITVMWFYPAAGTYG